MRITLKLWYRDYDGGEAYTTLKVEYDGALTGLISIINAYESVLSGLTDAYCFKAEGYVTLFTRAPVLPQPSSNVDRRLMVVFTQAERYATLVLPSGRSDWVETTGDRAGYRYPPGTGPSAPTLDSLAAAMGTTLSPDGLPFPNANWVASLMKNPAE